MTTGYTRQSAGQIITGSVIQASHFNNEFNQIEGSFNAVSGHNHDGTTGAGAKIPTAGLTNFTGTTSGIVVADGANSWLARSIAVPAAGITITNANGVSGNPTLALANDLAALEGLSSTGIAVRSTTDTWVQRSIAAGSNISVTNGDGVSGNPTIAVTGIGSSIQAYDAGLDNLAAFNTNAFVVQTANNVFTGRTITGTTNQITVTNGDGNAGNPVLSLPQDINNAAAVRFGSLSLNTSDTSEKLSVNGAGKFAGASASFSTGLEGAIIDYNGTNVRIGHVPGASGSAKAIQIIQNGSAVATWNTSGNLSLNTIIAGTWQGTVVGATYGGTGVNNGSNTLTISGGTLTLTLSGATNVTLPTSGTLATLASPTFTGTPAAPTASGTTNTTQIATTAMVQAAISTTGRNSQGNKTVSSSGPSGGSDGDIWYRV